MTPHGGGSVSARPRPGEAAEGPRLTWPSVLLRDVPDLRVHHVLRVHWGAGQALRGASCLPSELRAPLQPTQLLGGWGPRGLCQPRPAQTRPGAPARPGHPGPHHCRTPAASPARPAHCGRWVPGGPRQTGCCETETCVPQGADDVATRVTPSWLVSLYHRRPLSLAMWMGRANGLSLCTVALQRAVS